MKRILVTGATGLIGRHCVPALLMRGYEVHGLVPPQESVAPGAEVVWHAGDLFDAAAVGQLVDDVRPSHLLHLAWITTPGLFWNSPENLRWVEASLALVRAFHAAGGRRVVMTGSCAEYDWDHGCCREGVTPLRPATLYGRAKHALHTLVEGLAGQAGMSAAWGRVFFLYGPQAHPARMPGCVIRALLAGEIAACTEGNQIRDFLHASDVGHALAALVDSAVEGPVNIASGEPVRLAEMVRMVAEIIGRPELVRLGALKTPAGEPPILVADVRRLKEEVGWTPRFDLKSGLTDTVSRWAKNSLRCAS
jgi:nucleoside-diphosphate-sugar epimerase